MTLIGFSTSNALISRIIRWFTKSKVSHTFILFTDSALGGNVIMEATSMGVRIIKIEEWKVNNTIVELVTPAVSIDNGLKEGAAWLGEKYDYAGILGQVFVQVGRWFKRKIKSPLHKPNALFCSEFITNVLKASNYPGADKLDAPSMSPEALLEFLHGKR